MTPALRNAPSLDALESLLPPPPADAPLELTAPSASYKRSAWLATFGLLSFVAVYLGLTGYFALLVYRLFLESPSVPGFFSSLPALFFLGFLVRGLFVVKHSRDPYAIEVRAEDEPRLFAFLHALADQTGAPRPHRVFVSARVNAAVFYDLSFSNLLFPSKKNLEIGLGLVNALSLDELKAVLAHEFGHFAQRTMAVGRWVYVAHQIAGHVVVARTGFDKVLQFISRIDIRVAWIGWIMRLFVWAIRAVLDTFLRVVVLAHRALGRQMELQADRVAVSVSGSDSLIHALHRLGPADEAWEEAIGLADEERRAGRPVTDLFTLQSSALEHLRQILDEPGFGETPHRPVMDDPSSHRVFEEKLASPPRMWSTHPSNREREDHAKAIYLPSTLDPRPSWVLFRDPGALREAVTRALFEAVLAKQPAKGAPAAPAPIAESLARLARRYARPSLLPRYRGAYLGRAIAAFHARPAALFRADPAPSREAILAALDGSYPDGLRDAIASYRERREEELLLEGLADGVLTAPGGIIRHRGRPIRRRDLRGVIEGVREERKQLERTLIEHDVACRSAHRDAARALGGGWDRYLESLVALLHFATHASRAIDDAHSYVHHVLDIVLADGSVSSRERRQLVGAAADLQDTLAFAWKAHAELVLPSTVAERFAAEGGFTVFRGRLGMLDPNESNIGDWLQIADGWARGASGDLAALGVATLDTLLEAEHLVAEHFRAGTDPGAAPEAGTVPSTYPTCVVGKERERQKRLGLWDRFQTADGFLPGTARLVVASGVLLPAMTFGGAVAHTTIHVHNGLSMPVVVTIDGETKAVYPHATESFSHESARGLHVLTKTMAGRVIEAFAADADQAFGDYVYNVAQASAFVHWTAIYGPARGEPSPDEPRGAPRWFEAEEDVVLEAPPSSVSTRSGATETRTVLTALDAQGGDAFDALEAVAEASEKEAMRASHLAWEPIGSDAFATWLFASTGSPEVLPILRRRAAQAPRDVFLARAIQDATPERDRADLCARARARADAAPDDPDLRYLAIRCADESPERERAFVEAHEAFPEHAYLAYAAAGALGREDAFIASLAAWTLAARRLPVRSLARSAVIEGLRTHRAAVRARADGVPERWLPPSPVARDYFELVTALRNAPTDDEPPYFAALRALRAGDLAGAVRAVEGGPAEGSIVALAGTSEGASPALRRRALALDPARASGAPAGLLAALAIREGADVSPWLAALGDAPDAALVTEAVDLLRTPDRARHPEALEALAHRAELPVRGAILAMGLVVLGEAAPPSWRGDVEALLLEPERPFFRPGP